MRTTGRTGTLNWTDSGGDAERTLVLVHSLGTASALWMRQMEPFGRVRRVIAVDLPGHGASTADDHEYTLDELGRDVLAVCDDAGVGRFDYCGISIGGQIGLWLALEAPERVVSLVAACTAARIGDADKWRDRIDTVRQHGLEGLLDTVVAGWFGPSFAERDPEALLGRSRLPSPPPTPLGTSAAARHCATPTSGTGSAASPRPHSSWRDPWTPPLRSRTPSSCTSAFPTARWR